MKFNFQSLAYLFIAGLIGFTSCKKDDETKPAPTIAIKSNGTGADQTKGNAAPGQTINFNFEANASEKLSMIEIFETIGSAEKKVETINSDFDSDTKSVEDYDYTVPATASGTITLKFSVTDKSNGKASVSFAITVVASDYNTYNARLLAAPLGDKTSKSFFTSKDGGTHNVDVAKANATDVDFGYFFGASKKATFAAPSDFNTTIYSGLSDWGVKNTTEFVKVTADFNATMSSAAIIAAYDAGTKATDGDSPAGGATRIANLAKDQVIGFKTQAGKKGIIKIGTVVDGDGSTGSITFDVKVQK